MKLREIFLFEVEYRLRRVSTWLYALLLFGAGFLLVHVVNGGNSHVNGPQKVAVGCTVAGMLGMLVTAALFADAATRDVQARMHPLVYTAPVRPGEYLGGRFLGALAVNAVLLLGVPLGLLAGSRMPYLDPRMFGPVLPAAYVQPYLLFLLPNALLVGALLFAVAARTRQVLPAYVGAIGLFLAYLFSSELQRRITRPGLAVLADPFGISVLDRLTRYWTPVELDTRLIGYPGLLLWNRLAWMGVAAAVLTLLLRRFRFAHTDAGRRARVEREPSHAPVRPAPAAVPPVAGRFGARTRAWQTLRVARRSLGEVARNPAFAVILLLMVGLVMGVGWDVGSEAFGTSTWPVTRLVAGTVLGEGASVVVTLLVALFAGELVWRERDVRVSEIEDAAPVPTPVFLAGRFLALAVVLLGVQAALMASGVLLQTLQGYHRYEPGLYLRILFGIKLVDSLLLAALAMAVHVVVNQKYVGHLVVVALFLVTLLSDRLGIRHNLLRYASDPGWVYSDMNGFGPFPGPWTWFKLYWAAWALLLAVAARLFWVRGRMDGRRLRVARARFTGAAARAGAAAAVLIVALGGFLFYNTNVLNPYRTPRGAAAPWAEYERRYKRYEDAPQPSVAAAELRVEIYPGEGAAELRGTYRLVNRTDRAIDSVHVLVAPEVRARALSFDRPARRVLDDPRVQYRIYALERPLAPGDSLRLRFDVAFRPRGFPNSGISTAVVRNGSYFGRGWLPFVGYQPALELDDARARREHGLAPRRRPAPGDPRALRHGSGFRGDDDRVRLDAVIGTGAGQTALTPGTLVRQWTEGGRRYFHYRTEAPLSFGAPVFSAAYAERGARWNGVSLRVLYHPAHAFNVDRMVRGMRAALDYNTAHFGPYPYRELRVVEVPLYAGSNRAHPQTLAFSEAGAFLTRVKPGDVDRPFFVTAHETAHQWWGNQVSGADVPGRALVSETLAQYSAMMTMEAALGRAQVRRFYDYEMDGYLQGRRVFSSREVPLLDVEDQGYLYYHKGAVVMYTLRERLGEARVNAALRRFLERYRDAGPPYPTSRDLYAELRAVTPDSLRPLLRDLFEHITLWDVRAEAVRVQPAGAGAYRVTMDVVARKVRADSVGVETEVPMDDLVDVGVFGAGAGDPLYLRPHRIRSGRQTLTVTVPRAPARAGIDPFGTLIQRERDDNVVRVDPPT
ncbi:M1 family aminopeptidase [Longimicrobium sp.]|uniref:M1 family aminopeptidase n=1 Tax=Longimicrobium sp. TaxID=2029185 RepID=UPI002E34252F|nr:M1 family aminopeptidase [Longimicrobium sp.]HEX6037640.1 M1 family aminopeptidase [Longimicrobium sp.]